MSEQATLRTKDVIDRIFKEPGIQYELTEFENLGKPIHEIISIYPKVITTGKDAGKTKYFLKSFIPFSTGNEEVQVYAEGGKSAPEEIIRQLWVYKLIHQYGYKADQIDLEKSVQFGTEIGTKSADIIVYTDATKTTPKLIIECKKPKRKDGIEQLKSYMNAKGAPVAVWSNGADNIILIFAKIWDEKEAQEHRKDKTVEFGKVTARRFINGEERLVVDSDLTFDRINGLFHKACDEWPGIFKQGEDIELAKRHLQVCVGPIEGVRLMGSNLRIMDDAFEYLLPTEAKKKKGQFFTPRHVVEMCVRMLNPKRTEYVMDPACGSGGFLLHAMDWCYPANNTEQRELRKHRYASKYLWGIDFEQRAAKTSRALMLIAGDGHTNIFGPDVSSLDPRTWYENASGQALMQGLRQAKLTAALIPDQETLTDDDKAWEYFDSLRFDVILANPPFAGEMKDRRMLARYELARPALKRAGDDKAPKEERDVLFIERILKMLKPGGRAAIVLPQGKFNNSSLAFIREWILKKARLLAVVGLHPNTFKPHTGTKTSVLFVQKYTQDQLDQIAQVHDAVAVACPDYAAEIATLLSAHGTAADVPDDAIPEAVADLIAETFSEPEAEEATNGESEEADKGDAEEPIGLDADPIAVSEEKLNDVKALLLKAKQQLMDLESDKEALEQQKDQEIAVLTLSWSGEKAELRSRVSEVKETYKTNLQTLKARQRLDQKPLKAIIKALEKKVPEAERDLKQLTNRGRLELILADGDLIGTLKERWISAEVSKQLDYPIFMAVSERGGKNNSGDYEFMLDENGGLIEFPDGHPQEGQLVVNQDLVNYDLGAEDLADASKIPDEQLCVAEAFVRFALKQKFSFWESE